MPAEKSKRGRPSKYMSAFCERARAMCEAGALDVDLARAFDVHVSTVYAWRSEFPEFREATTRGKKVADDAVEAALFRRATGYNHDAVKIMQAEGEILRAEYVEHYPPDTTAAIFWLKNRRPAEWRDKTEQAHVGEVTVTWLQPGDPGRPDPV